jgi:phosphoribosylglycinamide formyltransferase-1
MIGIKMAKLNLCVFISGGGSNLQSIIDAVKSGELKAEIRLVLSNNPSAYGLIRAKEAGIPTVAISSGNCESRESFVSTLMMLLEKHGVDFIALAGYLRKIPPEIISKYKGRIVNIHPGPLPDFGGRGMFGLRVHEAVLEEGLEETCATIHHVTEGYDEGNIIATSPVPVLEGDTPESLQQRVLQAEHALYPAVLQGFAEGRFD